MDCQSLQQPDLMLTESTRRRSCTTQSEPVKTAHADDDFKMDVAHSPQQMSLKCEGSPTEPDARHLPHTFASSHEQSHSYPSPELVPFYGSPLPSQLITRSQTWAAPQASSWAGDASPNYSFATSESPRGLPPGSFNHGPGTAHNLEQSQSYPHRQPLDYQPSQYQETGSIYSQRYPSISAENLSCYGQLGMPTTAPTTDNFSYGNYSVISGPVPQDIAAYRRYPLEGYTSAPSQSRPLTVTTSFPQSAYPNPPGDELSTPMTPVMTPVSDMDEDLPSACYDDERRSGSPTIKMERGEAGEPETPKSGETPYAKLIYQAFMSSPRRALTLQEIYQWFRDNTDKGKPGQGKGWQNSIRHNLSMNGAFERKQIQSDGKEEDCVSPSATGKRATEWVLQDWAVKEGVQSTTRYRNSARRNQNKRNPSRLKTKAAHSSPRRTARRRMTPREMAHPYALPSGMAYGSIPEPRSRYYAPYTSAYDLSAAEQLQRLSLAPAPRFNEHRGYEYHHPTMSSPLEMHVHNGYHSAPPGYSIELFLPSVPGAPTVASEDDINEVITPEASFSMLEPTVCGDNSPANACPTSEPYSQAPSTYYSSADERMDGMPRYSMGDVAGVCDDSMLRSCGWDEEESSQH